MTTGAGGVSAGTASGAAATRRAAAPSRLRPRRTIESVTQRTRAKERIVLVARRVATSIASKESRRRTNIARACAKKQRTSTACRASGRPPRGPAKGDKIVGFVINFLRVRAAGSLGTHAGRDPTRTSPSPRPSPRVVRKILDKLS